MTKFEIGAEYKLIKRNGELAARTFTVEKISHKKMAIMVKGGIHGIFNMTTDNKGNELIIIGMNDRNYLCPSAADKISK